MDGRCRPPATDRILNRTWKRATSLVGLRQERFEALAAAGESDPEVLLYGGFLPHVTEQTSRAEFGSGDGLPGRVTGTHRIIHPQWLWNQLRVMWSLCTYLGQVCYRSVAGYRRQNERSPRFWRYGGGKAWKLLPDLGTKLAQLYSSS